jgi:CelD/BcsL family acetyltransferase involved in cellulose biosynthesis
VPSSVNSILRLVLLNEIPENEELRARWNALASSVPRPQVFYTYEWALAVQRAYGATLRPLVFLAYDETEALCGIAALAQPEKDKASFLCATTGDYCDFLSLPEHRAMLVTMVLSELRKQGIGKLVLTNLPADSESVAALREASVQIGYRYFARTAYLCSQVVLANLPRRRSQDKPYFPRRKMVRHSMNAMGRGAPVRIEHVVSWTQLEPILPEFMQTHIGRFLFTGRISNQARPERRLFLQELAKLLSQSGWLVLSRMVSGAHVCAWHYGFRFHDTWFWYQPTFDSSLEKHSPGFCLLTKIIEDADESGLKIVDLGLGAEEYKDRLANGTRQTLYVTLNSSAARHYRERARYGASRLVKITSETEAATRWLIKSLSRIRAHGSAGSIGWACRKLRELVWLKTEVFFYEFVGNVVGESAGQLRALDLNALADAASQYIDDQGTLDYLLRAASRLHNPTAEGYGLVDSQGRFLHFAWTTRFDGFFLSELSANVDAPSPETLMLFDCWTPVSQRGHGHYGRAISGIAQLVQERGKRPWIFSARTNAPSVRGIERAGFEKRYSLIRQRLFGLQRVKGKTPRSEVASIEEVSARV